MSVYKIYMIECNQCGKDQELESNMVYAYGVSVVVEDVGWISRGDDVHFCSEECEKVFYSDE